MKFDPMTGEPIEEVNETESMTPPPTPVAPQQVPVEPYPMQEPQQKKGLKIGIIVAAVACVVIFAAILIAIASGLFMSDKDRVMKAIVNTMEDSSDLTETLNKFEEISLEDKFTTSMRFEYDGVGIEAEYRKADKEKQIWALADIQGYPELEGTIAITDGQIQAYTPFLNDVLFVYNYREANDGYLMQELTKDDIELINQMCEILYDVEGYTKENVEANEEATEAFKEWYDAIEVEKLDEKETFEINGKDKKCTGYRMVITEDTVVEFLEAYAILLEDYDIEYTVEGVEVSMDDLMDAMIDEVDGMEDVQVDFYLDSNMLAAVVIEVDGEEMEILFRGGDYRAQNVVVEFEGQDIIEIEGETDGDVEEVTWSVAGQEFVTYEYDAKSGDFETVLYDEYGDKQLVMEGTFVVEKDRVAFEGGSIEFVEDDMKFDIDIVNEKGAELEQLEGEELDIGNASLSDLQDALSFLY